MINSKRLLKAFLDAVKTMVIGAGIIAAFSAIPVYIMINFTPHDGGGVLLLGYMVLLILTAFTTTNYLYGKDE